MAIPLIDPTPGNDTMSDVYIKINDTIDAVNGITFNNTLLTKVVSIGDWNMDSASSVNVAHGLADITKIRSINVIIFPDTGNFVYTLDFFLTGSISGGIGLIDSTNINIQRTSGGTFDSTDFDATSFNRGYVHISYIS